MQYKINYIDTNLRDNNDEKNYHKSSKKFVQCHARVFFVH